MTQRRKRLSLVKGRQRYVFDYVEGDESRLMRTFVDMAGNPQSDFDWFDAAVLSYQMGRQLEARMAPAAQARVDAGVCTRN